MYNLTESQINNLTLDELLHCADPNDTYINAIIRKLREQNLEAEEELSYLQDQCVEVKKCFSEFKSLLEIKQGEVNKVFLHANELLKAVAKTSLNTQFSEEFENLENATCEDFTIFGEDEYHELEAEIHGLPGDANE